MFLCTGTSHRANIGKYACRLAMLRQCHPRRLAMSWQYWQRNTMKSKLQNQHLHLKIHLKNTPTRFSLDRSLWRRGQRVANTERRPCDEAKAAKPLTHSLTHSLTRLTLFVIHSAEARADELLLWKSSNKICPSPLEAPTHPRGKCEALAPSKSSQLYGQSIKLIKSST